MYSAYMSGFSKVAEEHGFTAEELEKLAEFQLVPTMNGLTPDQQIASNANALFDRGIAKLRRMVDSVRARLANRGNAAQPTKVRPIYGH